MSLRAHWLLLSLFGLTCMAGPAQADQLQSWRFDRTSNRLEFKTDEAVQPTAQLVFNPTRVVVDLPGIRLGRPQLTENVGGAIRSYRLGQFNPTTARIVIELAPGYTLDPNAVRVRGITNSNWVIELPQPQLESTSPSPITSPPLNPGTSNPGTGSPGSSAPIVPSAATRIEELRQTGDGLFIRTSGQTSSPRVRRSRDLQTIDIDITNATLNAPTIPQSIAATDLGIDQILISQVQQSPPLVRISLRVPKNGPNWRATASNLGGIVLLPESRPDPSSPTTPPSSTPVGSPASVQVISYDYQNNQLLIQVDRQVAYNVTKQGVESQIVISPAKLAAGTTAPRMANDAPLRQLQVRQDGPQSVRISVTPNNGYQVGGLRFLNPQLLALDVFLTGSTSTFPPSIRPLPRPGSPSTSPSIIVEPPVSRPTIPSRPLPLPGRPLPGNSSELPVPSGRKVVVLDPGHGGPDPGAVGINNIYEKEIVLDISTQVARLLEQQGVTVIMTRSSDIDLDLQPRVDIAERANAAVFVSIHSNSISLSRPDVNGLETYYYDSGASLAQAVHQSILEDVPIADRRVRQARFFVIRKTSMPAILIETGFVTGADDARNFQNSGFRRAMANGIARGILRYLR